MAVAIEIRGPLRRADLPGLVERVCPLLENAAGQTVEALVAGVEADAVALDALARLQLAARRRGCRVVLCGASSELSALVRFAGLREVLPARG